jgi:hypothetical protein
MTATTLHERILESKDWATILFITSLALIALTKTVFESRFSDFIRLMVSDKYIKIYKDSGNLMSWFNVLLFLVQIISISFFVQIVLSAFGYVSKADGVIYMRISTLLSVFILSKYLVEKIIATVFDIEEFTEHFNLQKVSYRTYLAIALLPINIILFYNNNISITLINIIIFIVLSINVLAYLNSLKIYQNLIIGKIFYFILYLCTLEIAPYYIIYYLFTRN